MSESEDVSGGSPRQADVNVENEQSPLVDTVEPSVQPAKSEGESDGETKIKADETKSEKSEKTVRISEDERESGGKRTPLNRTSSKGSDTEGKSPDTRPRSTDSSGRPKSSGSTSGEVVFEAKGRRKKRSKTSPDAHTVTFTVTISMAIPTLEDEDQPDAKDVSKKKKRVLEAPRAQNYYHMEYYLVPDDGELMKTDVVTYGMAAKIYMERNDPRLLRTWQEGDVTWVAWSHSHTLEITKDLLLKMFNHTLELRIWDTKDKVGTRARFDRLRFIKLGKDEGDEAGVKSIVIRQSNNFIKMQPKKSCEVRPLPTRISFQKSDLGSSRRSRDQDKDLDEEVAAAEKARQDRKESLSSDKKSGSEVEGSAKGQGTPMSPTPHTLMGIPNRSGEDGRKTYSRLGRLAGADGSPQSPGKDSRRSKSSSDCKSRADSQGSQAKPGEAAKSPGRASGIKSADSKGSQKNKDASPVRLPAHRRRRSQAAAQSLEYTRKHGICVVPIRMSSLFAGFKSVTNRLENPIPGMEDVFVTVAMDGPLMSEEQKQELNPMIIKVHSATNMPDTPMNYMELGQKCQPVYCKYKFFNQPLHISTGREHGRNIYYDDVNVVLTGIIEPSELRQYLNGPSLEIEVHDRDRKPEDVKLKPSLFGDDLEDEKISNVGTVSSRRTLHNPFHGRDKPWDPYGVAKVDLSELLLSHRYLYIKVPIHNCPVPEVLGQKEEDGKVVGVAGAVDGPVDRPFSAGHYLHSNAMLKLKVELAHPLTTPESVAAKEHLAGTTECPFGRIVFLFEYQNTQLLYQLQNLVTHINARALELDDMPQHVIDAALSTYKLSIDQQKSRELDIVTGFQLLDNKMHLFVLEGLREGAIHDIWESLPQPENSDVLVLYHSDLSFSERLYGPLDVDLCRVKLHEPLAQIVQQPLLYVRDMVPKPCFESLLKLQQLTKMSGMKCAVRNNLFPTAEMVVSMSREFGVPLLQEDFEELQPHREKSVHLLNGDMQRETMGQESSRVWEPMDNFNPDYMERIVEREMKGSNHDFLKENIEDVQRASFINMEEKKRIRPKTVRADVDVAHNYSAQFLNSTELAKEKLRESDDQSDVLKTYCPDYHHSMTWVPINVEKLKRREQEESYNRWRTQKGFIFPGMKTMQESNVHPMKPDVARRDELQEPWRENILHVGLLQAPLPRKRWTWERRHQDLELYRRPVSHFGHTDPITIHLAGEKLKQEKLSSLRREYDNWKSKIIVSDTRQHIHRCLPETEMRERGRKSGNQIDKLKGLLKDNPVKSSLRRPPMSLTDIPPLNVVLNPSVDIASRESGLPTMPAVSGEGEERIHGFKPGPFESLSWLMEYNKIPSYDYDHKAFKDSKGDDFNVYHKNRNKLWKKTIHPLCDEERDNHLFRLHSDTPRHGILPGLDLGDRSLTQAPVDLTGFVTFTDPNYNASAVSLSSEQNSFPQNVESVRNLETMVN